MALATNNLLFHSRLSGSDILGDTIRRLNVAKLTSLDFAHAIMAKHGVTSGIDHPHRSFIFRAFNDWQDETGTVTLASSHPNQRIHQHPLRNNTNEGGVKESVPLATSHRGNGVFKQQSVGATFLSSAPLSRIKRTLAGNETATATAKQIGRLIQRKPLSNNQNSIGITSAMTNVAGDTTASKTQPSAGVTSSSDVSFSKGNKNTLTSNSAATATAKQIGRLIQRKPVLNNQNGIGITSPMTSGTGDKTVRTLFPLTWKSYLSKTARGSEPGHPMRSLTSAWPSARLNMTLQKKAPTNHSLSSPADIKNTTSEKTIRNNPVTVALPTRLSALLPLVYKRIGTNSIMSELSTERGLKSNISNPLLSPVSRRGLLIQRKPLMSNSYGVSNQTLSTRSDGVQSAGLEQRSPQGTFAPVTSHAKGIGRILSTATTRGSNALIPGKESLLHHGIPRVESDSITRSILTPDFNQSMKNVGRDSSTLASSAPLLSFFTAPDLSHRILANSFSNRLIKQTLSNTSHHQSRVHLPLNPVGTRGVLAKHEPLLSNTTKLSNTTQKSNRNFNDSFSSAVALINGRVITGNDMATTKNLYAVPSSSPINNEESRIRRLEGKTFVENVTRPQLTLVSNNSFAKDTGNAELTLHSPRQERSLSSEPSLEISHVQSELQSENHSGSLIANEKVAHSPASTSNLSAEALADKVYRILERRLTIERERRGIY